MDAFRVHINHLKKEYDICKQDPYFKILEKSQQRSNPTELFRCFEPFFGLQNFLSLTCLPLSFLQDLLRSVTMEGQYFEIPEDHTAKLYA